MTMNIIKVVKTFDEACTDARKTMLKAAALSLNQAAFQASKNAKEIVSSKFTLRNNFTESSIRYTKCARATSIADLKSEVGILERAGYMVRQEEGGRKTSPSGSALVIPTTYARRNNPKNKLPASMYYAKIKERLVKMPSGHGSKSANSVARAFVAKNTGGFVRYNDGIFKVTSFKAKGGTVSFKKKLVLNLKHSSTYTPPTPWLTPAAEQAAKNLQVYFNKNMDKA